MRIVIGEDEALLRQGLQLLLHEAGLTVVGVAADATSLVRLTAEQAPDIVLTDIQMPPNRGEDGLQAAIELRGRYPDLAVLVLSQHVNRQYAHDLIGDRPAGVGYLLKQRVADVADFVRAIHSVATGGLALDPEVVAVMLSRARRTRTDLTQLTPREFDTIRLVAEGKSNLAIARVMEISERAVINNVSRIYTKLDLPPSSDDHRRVLAVIRYLDAR